MARSPAGTRPAPEALRRRRASWPEPAHFGVRAHRAAEAERLRAATAAYTGGDGSPSALLAAGRAGREPSSSEAARPRLPEEYGEPVPAAVEAVAAEVPDTRPPRALSPAA
ncbi:hypothetical protein ACSNOK_27765 [Streptomyces sp. URMC 126]|uniref:hypothetical protein n=1 Tax=Streptomyces sp. URMC 126 TaxID=3423401 RepID=UPI003F196128